MRDRVVLATACVLAFNQIASAVEHGSENPLVCDWLRGRIAQAESQLNPARLNDFLFQAADDGCGTIVLELLDRGASVFARDGRSNTALLYAARSGHKELVALLLDKGADINHANLDGSTALGLSIARRRHDVVALLLERGASTAGLAPRGSTLLATAAFEGDQQLVRVLLSHHSDPNEPDGTGKGPLVYSAAKGLTPIVRMLLDAGADPNRRYAHSLTALMWTAGYPDTVPARDGLATAELLLARGASIHAVDDRGRSALMIAAGRGHAEMVGWLIAHGADATLKDGQGKTAADLATDAAVLNVLQTVSAGQSPAR
ncbi:ankyrin repeat domain-containing protein [Mesorhizobium sp. BAC0120]|uniref:ankyrin repeat domain-containing protein n=1 Tax=Mesorhizobium sp. BAC0120 TaxID=3090670 RepID=UPI00298C2C1F|nr:ankyrin repeat domain-containing protein [Mesorhizobium sp. BAC0120]MDW6022630.1 ankyrin repeat domain-containing protein [Mesorhizobium sp. BAC0120]